MANLRLPRVMTHVFPTASEYDARYRHRLQQRKVVLMTAGVMVASAVIAFIFKSAVLFTRTTNGNLLTHGAFDVIQQLSIDEIKADVIIYRHKKSQSDVMTIVPQDKEQDSVFGISFRTIPTSDNGAIHVLQRSVLDGSIHYPVKDPIHELKKGSLQTYMKATVLEDRTVYAAASRNRLDFSNLMKVHLDAVFNPICLRNEGAWIFRQEGWRLERVDTADRDLGFNGNAYNEMRGIYGDPDQLIKRFGRRVLFADTHYGFDAEGYPEDILSLHRHDIEDAYHQFYHPTNAQVFLYGNLDSIRDGMDILDGHLKHYPARFDLVKSSTPALQPYNLQDGTVSVHAFPSTFDEQNYQVLLSWLLNEKPMDIRTELCWMLIEHMLMGTPESTVSGPLLGKPYYGDKVIGGLDMRHQQWTFTVGLKGVKRVHVKDVEDKIKNAIKALVDIGGYDSDKLAGAINTVDIKLRDHSSGNFPRGVRLMDMVYAQWNYGKDPTKRLAYDEAWTSLQTEIANMGSSVLLDLIREHLVENTHYAVVQLFPKTGMVKEAEDHEKERINSMMQTQSKEEFTKLLAEAGNLQDVQAAKDPASAVASIPRLPLEAIDRIVKPNIIQLRVEKDVLVATTRVPDSFGMLFVDFGLDLRLVDFEDAFLLPVLMKLMMTMPTKAWTEEQLYRQISKYSGGIEPVLQIEDVRPRDADFEAFIVNDGTHLSTKLFFRGRCKADKLGPYLNVLSEIVFNTRKIVHSRTKEAVLGLIEEIDVNIFENGAEYVDRRIDARYSKKALAVEELMGISQLQRLTDLRNEEETDFEYLQERLTNVRTALQIGHRNGMILSITGEPQLLEDAEDDIQQFVTSGIPENANAIPFAHSNMDPHPWMESMADEKFYLAPMVNEGIVVPAAVSFIGKGATVFDTGEAVSGSSSVVAKFIENGFLFEKFVIDRGAFDAMARISYRHGTARYLVFRDPNRALVETLSLIDDIGNDLARTVLNVPELPLGAHEATISTIAELDGPAPQPDEIGWEFLLEYLREDTSEYRQLWRDQILNTTRQDFVQVVNDLLQWENPTVSAISTIQEFEDAQNRSGLELQITRVAIV